MKRKIILGIGIFIMITLILVGGYVGYMSIQYYRIDDYTIVETSNQNDHIADATKEFKITTYNIGFGAYDHDFSFFMDSGVMKDGTTVQGKNARAQSEEIVQTNTNGALQVSKQEDSDFYFFQEVDVDATRSHHINQQNIIQNAFDEYGAAFASAFHSAYLMYPFHEPHGAVDSGLLTLSRFKVDENIRRQYPVDDSFITKFTDLDRCFLVTRIPLSNGSELVLINSHMSAYDKGGTIRKQQLDVLNNVLTEEYEKGNYVIVGGDFNHDIANSIDAFESEQEVPNWVFSMNDDDVSEHFNIVQSENADTVATCRSTDIPYKKGVNYSAILDGFIISDNISASAYHIDSDFMYSDHNPVTITFRLK